MSVRVQVALPSNATHTGRPDLLPVTLNADPVEGQEIMVKGRPWRVKGIGYSSEPGFLFTVYCEESEPADELTQAELERLIRLARDVKRKAVGHVTVDLSPVNGGLWIVGYKRAA